MEKLSFDDLRSHGMMNFTNCDKCFGFLEAGYFHVDDCEGDHHYYYRYIVNGIICEMLEDEVHELHAMSFQERETRLHEMLF